MPGTKPTASEARRSVGRPRSEEVTGRLHESVLELLHREGPGAVTVEAVSALSGVAKTSIYRRYSDRRDLLRSVLHDAVGSPQPPSEGTVRERIRVVLEEVWRQMSDVLGRGGMAAIVVGEDAEFSELFQAALAPFDEALVARIDEDARTGLLREDVDADGLVTILIGAYLGEIVRHGEVGEDWLDRCLDLIWATVAAEC